MPDNVKEYDLQEDLEGKKPEKRSRNADDSIYGDIGDYIPSSKSSRHRDRDGNRHSYFDKQDNEPVDNAAPSYKISKSAEILNKLQQEPEGYAECYPGLLFLSNISFRVTKIV